MKHCYSYDVKLYPIDESQDETTLNFESHDEAMDAAEDLRCEIGEKWSCIEVVEIDWYYRCDRVVASWDF